MPKAFPKEFREDVVRVARNREPGVTLRQLAADFGISQTCLGAWVRAADVEDGLSPASSSESESTENRELRKRVRLLEQENEVLRRAAAYLSQAHLPGK